MALFLRPHERRKDGKVHTYWSLVENRRAGNGRVVQLQVLYLGALSPIQELSWEKTAQQFDPPPTRPEALNGLASERELLACSNIERSSLSISRPAGAMNSGRSSTCC